MGAGYPSVQWYVIKLVSLWHIKISRSASMQWSIIYVKNGNCTHASEVMVNEALYLHVLSAIFYLPIRDLPLGNNRSG